MKERPILFSAPMVRAILDGNKTQTRRIAKGMALDWINAGFHPKFIASTENKLCPYGQVGDRLWVRESGAKMPLLCPADPEYPFIFRHDVPTTRDIGHYWVQLKRACGASYNTAISRADFLRSKGAKAVPSIHMPRWASRITLEITGVRVERLNEISEEDARAEGITDGGCLNCGNSETDCGCLNPQPDARDSFIHLWQSINGEGSWAANPWVWVVQFKRLEGYAA